MCIKGISRNIPARYRSLILDRASEIAKWPNSGQIRAQVIKDKIRITYDGNGRGYACLRIDPEDDFEKRLIAIDRLISHDNTLSLINASLQKMQIEVDYDPVNKLWLDDDLEDHEVPLWAWDVPEEMAIAYKTDTPAGIKDWIDREMSQVRNHLKHNPGSHSFGKTSASLRANGWGLAERRCGHVELFSARNEQGLLSWNTGKHYLKINTTLPDALLSSLEGRPVGEVVTHPLLHPETVIKYAKSEKGTVTLEMWRQGATLCDPPVKTLQEAIEIQREYERLR